MHDIEHLSKNRKKFIQSLCKKKNRIEHRLFLAEGRKCVLDTINYFKVNQLIATQQELSAFPILREYPNLNIASPKEMTEISQLSTAPSVIAVYEMPESPPCEPFPGLNLVVDCIQDPGNLGTIIRIADWFGIKRIFASNDTVDVFNSKTIQATMGSVSRVDVIYTDIIDLIRSNPKYSVVGTLLDGENIFAVDLPSDAFIVMGNEGSGISDEVKKLVTHKILIPSYPPGEKTCESLNVGMATAITLAEFRRRSLIF